ncbi:amino acid adenylation domain-containing protein [Streptomyces sp. NPDC018045]|uniref:amino acid adenylation domain-containing protein n=1 Tax=Streptomyces sp. NPDC018045 TaxID=3365037 RepID=UPI00378C4676
MNGPAHKDPRGTDFLALWARSVHDHADAPALIDGERTLSYRAMDRLTDRWAAELAARGAGPEEIVGLAFATPRDTVLGMVATLKSGAGFTVLDPRLPPAARHSLVSRVGACAWAGDGEHAPAGAWRPSPAPGQDPARPWRTRPADARQLAYVLFTSGSTGQPKGIVIERAALGHFASAVATRLALAPEDRWLQIASLGFDVVIEEVFPALAAGAAVVCRRDGRALDAEELHSLLTTSGTTVVELSTQYWLEYARWLRAGALTTPEALRTVVVGGERMDPDAYRRWQREQRTALVHVYGLTECTVSSTMYAGTLPDSATDVPLGTPLDGAEVTVRRDGRVVPVGETGEIHIGGPLLGRGFLDDPEQTARRFPLDPLSPDPEARVYVTGDLGRIDEDGQLVFLGRVDDQIKIRGHRLEPAHVERELCGTGRADQAVVFPDPDTGTSLWAFIVPREPGAAPPPGEAVRLSGAERAELTGKLAAALPDWAVPQVLYRVAVLPKNPHGKIDRRQLAAWTGGRTPGPAQPAPETAEEPLRTVLHHFRDVLREPALGPDDNFFDHGGQSILAMRLLALLRESFRAAEGLRAATLFTSPTPRRLSQVLTRQAAGASPH